MEDHTVKFTQKELQLIYVACKSYGDKLAETKKNIPNEDEMILDRLADRAKRKLEFCKKGSRMYAGIKSVKYRREKHIWKNKQLGLLLKNWTTL